jgi:oligogalacturonide lyase
MAVFRFLLHGRPQAYAEHRPEHRQLQLTNCDDLNEWSIHPAHNGEYLYFSAGSRVCRIDMDTHAEEVIADFGSKPLVAPGMVGAGMGTLSVSTDDRWIAVPVCAKNGSRLYVINTETGSTDCIAEAPSIFHPQFHPDDSSLLRYSGPHSARMWVLNRDGSDHRLVYERDVVRKEWVVHETWIPGTREMLTVDWPRGVFRVSIDDGIRRIVSRLNAWHPVADRAGRRVVTDTLHPDRGICVFDLEYSADNQHEVICQSRASSLGDHWNNDHCPYDDGPVQVYAPQHTHPHPRFSPDGRYIVFTSDYSGVAQVIEVDLRPENDE